MRRSRDPNGKYVADEYIIDNDGWLDEPARIRVEMRVHDDAIVADFTGSDPQRDGSCNLTLVATVSAVYNAVLHMTDSDIPSNAGRYRPIEVIAPEGTVVHARYPVATVGGNSEVHPHLVSLIWKAMSEALPDRVGACGSETAMLVTFGGVDPATGEMFSTLIIEGQGYGGKLAGDGWDVITVPNSNCVVTPVEVYETRYPVLHTRFELDTDTGGAGRSRGGMGAIRELELLAPLTVSCYHSKERLVPWGLFGGGEGNLSSFKVRAPGDAEFKNFRERYGVRCAGKFTNVHLPTGAQLELSVGGGGGYGDPATRDPEAIAIDIFEGFESEERARRCYPEQIDAALAARVAAMSGSEPLRKPTREGRYRRLARRFWRVGEAPLPEPGAGEALVRVLASGVCFTDVHQLREDRFGMSSPRIPVTSHSESSKAWAQTSIWSRQVTESVQRGYSAGAGTARTALAAATSTARRRP